MDENSVELLGKLIVGVRSGVLASKDWNKCKSEIT